MRRILFFLTVLWMAAGTLSAATADDYDNVIYTRDAKVKQGGRLELPIYLKNTDYAVKSFQFNIVLPEGVKFVSADNGFQHTLAPQGWTSSVDTPAGKPENTALVIAYYMSASDLSIAQGGDEAVMTITLEADDDAEGLRDLILTPVKLTDGTGKGHSLKDIKLMSQLTILPQGDVNGDGQVSIADVTALIAILGGAADTYGTANVNGDQHVDLADLNALVALIMSK